MSDPTLLVQLSDLHLGDSEDDGGHVGAAANLRRVAATVRAMDLRPDAVLLTGDLSDTGTAESYRLLRRIVADELEPLGCPVLTVVGNHDHRGTFRHAYLGDVDGRDDAAHHVIHDLDDVRVVMCDSYLAGEISGRLGEDQLAWLDQQLATAGDLLPIVAVHHPSVPRGVPRRNDHLLEDREAFEDVIARHRVGAVLCGHAHVSAATAFGGTFLASAPATAYLYDPSTRGSSRRYEGAGFAICTVREGRAIVNHHIIQD